MSNFTFKFLNSGNYGKNELHQVNKIRYYRSANPHKSLEITSSEQVSLPKQVNPNIYSNLDYLLSINGYLTSNFTYISNTKNNPFWELLYQDKSSGIYYDYVSTLNSIQSINADNYNWNVPQEGISAIIRNDKRFNVMNQTYILKEDISSELFPPIKYIPLIDINGKEIGISSPLKLTTTLKSLSFTKYTENTINRTSAFIFEPNNVMFLLIDTINKKIYVMQTWTNNTPSREIHPPNFFYVSPANIIDPNINFYYLTSLLTDSSIVGTSNVLPVGWAFTQCKLDSVSMVLLMTNPEKGWHAKVITDGLGNNYQYIREEEAPFLYDIFNQ
jgi:hypothetical protein